MKNITKNLIILFTNLLISNILYSQNGSLDTTFGILGKTSNNFGQNNQAYDSKIQNDGKIIVVGNTYSIAPGSSFLVTRYLTNGDLDVSFGDSGYVTTLVGDHCSASSVSLQNDGKIVVAGTTFTQSGNITDSDIMIVRYNNDGKLDLTFGINGIKILKLNYSQTINSILIQSNGNIIVGGGFTLMTNPNQDTFGLARLTPNGTVDTTFGVNGYVYTPNIYRGEILDMKFIDNEDIIAVGRRHIISNYLMVRYNSNGQVINSFGNNNNGIVEVSYNNIAQLNKCVISSNNEIYAAGSTYNNIKYKAFITKYNSNGIIDNTFGTNGIILRDFGNTSTGVSISSFADDICFDNNNNLIVGYGVGPINDYDFGLESFNSAGVLNNSFGKNGFFTTTFGDGHEYFSTMLIQSDNKIVMAGNKGNQVLARINNQTNLSNYSIDEVKNISFFPNPFNGLDEIYININGSGKINIDLYDLNGKLISKLITDKILYDTLNVEKLNLSRIDLPKGMYLLKINLNDQVFKAIKIIKN
ncbi:T9SS type A sorting domain-containing protein [Flavobacterium sp. Fl-77]|uniref:T9SS type A sorting domain-containing protein n=1 Tax=Flavobacterium flavipigmentatum TaxID=2893884 RepID=A0AAJ2S6A0_9FLAO|nr:MULTISPECIES: delta-60 repeat domain-containing protein [unclassified Flavobacterium]MDX6181130.1 T9SS type A sorting domain-containing protein [Flavobacterium sp. Fl-33]MDX6184731.1 T9SS type A sorting domain-containing protein [Flavobacterium sp. Fl-77]UFH39830.1 T9SS type A sorting domain-containing protein [Flavobacterium sp. F-70]